MHFLGLDAFVVCGHDGAFAVGEGEDGCAELDGFERCVLGYVAGAGDGDAFALEGFFAAGGVLDHVLYVLWSVVSSNPESRVSGNRCGKKKEKTYVDETKASSFGPDQASTPSPALACQAAFPDILLRLVGAEHPSDLAWGDTNVTCRHICICADVSTQLRHEGDAEFADFVVGFAFGVEVGATLTAADIHYNNLCQPRSILA